MFIISNSDTKKRQVEYLAPKDGDGFEKITFKAEFRVLPQARVDEIMARSRAASRSQMARVQAAVRGQSPYSVEAELSEEECARLDQDIMDEVFITWHEIKNPDRSDYEDTPENRAFFLSLVGIRSAIVSSWMEMVGVVGERKNSKPPRSTG